MSLRRNILLLSIIFIWTCSSPTKSELSQPPPTLNDFSITTSEDTPVDITLQKYRIDGQI